MTKKLTEEAFVKLAIDKLRLENYQGIHSIYSGLNEAYKTYFEGADPIETTDRLAKEGKIALRPVKGGVMLYPPGEVRIGLQIPD